MGKKTRCHIEFYRDEIKYVKERAKEQARKLVDPEQICLRKCAAECATKKKAPKKKLSGKKKKCERSSLAKYNKASRKSPPISAKDCAVGDSKKGKDGATWRVEMAERKTKQGVMRYKKWVK